MVEWIPRIVRPQVEATDADIRIIEAAKGVSLPLDYVEVVRRHQGAMPSAGSVEGDGFSTAIEYLYLVTPSLSDVHYILNRETFSDPSMLAFAHGLGGDTFLFRFATPSRSWFRRPVTPPPEIWVHTSDNGDTPFVRLASSFSEMVEKFGED